MTTAATTDFCDHTTLEFFKEGAQWLVTIYFATHIQSI